MERMISSKIVECLRCPCCGKEMSVSENGASLLCSAPKRHCFDFSASGYINLAPTHSGGGDSKAAVRSRTDFLNSGAYEPVSDALNAALANYLTENAIIVDAGCGEGYYSCRTAKEGFLTLGFDLSRDAVTAASKRARRDGVENTFFGVGSVFSLPIASGSADAVINIFAPCAEEEYSRVLKNGGILAVAYAGPEHLMGLKKAIYDSVYENESRSDMPRAMELIEERRIRYEIELTSSEQISNLFSMTPYYWRTSPSDKERLSEISRLITEVDIIIAIYKN